MLIFYYISDEIIRIIMVSYQRFGLSFQYLPSNKYPIVAARLEGQPDRHLAVAQPDLSTETTREVLLLIFGLLIMYVGSSVTIVLVIVTQSGQEPVVISIRQPEGDLQTSSVMVSVFAINAELSNVKKLIVSSNFFIINLY